MRLLAFAGKAGHGKDTCARIARQIVRDEYDAVCAHYAFAWPLKMRCYGIDQRLTWEELLAKPPHVRRLFQIEGTEKGRDVYGLHLWTRHADAYLRLVEEAMPEVSATTCSDVRFPNELDFARERGLALWIDSDRPTLTGEAAQHLSEIALDHLDRTTAFDGRIRNDRTTSLTALRQQIRPYVARLLGAA